MAATGYVITGRRPGHAGFVVVDFRTTDDRAWRINVPYAQTDTQTLDMVIRAVIAGRPPPPVDT